MIEIAKALLIGVGAGLTTTLILGMYRLRSRRQDRSEQITYLRELIDTHIRLMLDAIDVQSTAGLIVRTAAHARFAHFGALQSELQVALSTRVTALTYKEVSSLQRVLTNIERAMKELHQNEHRIMHLRLAQDLYEQFQDLNWLGLPKKEGS